MRISGIQKRFLKYTLPLFLIAILLSFTAIFVFMRNTTIKTLTQKNHFQCEKMGISLDELYSQTDSATAGIIINENVQKSLWNRTLTGVESAALTKYFGYIRLSSVADYAYVDNKQNVYTRSYSVINYSQFQESKLSSYLKDEYSTTRWFVANDTLFGTNEKSLFVARYIRCMDASYVPGEVFLKMDNSFLGSLIRTDELKESAVGIMDEHGEVFDYISASSSELDDSIKEKVLETAEAQNAGIILDGDWSYKGILTAYRQPQSGMIIFSFIPAGVINREVNSLALFLLILYVLIMITVVVFSFYFSIKYTEPITEISDRMSGFGDGDFDNTLNIHTGTELDRIGDSYNLMLNNIKDLLTEVKEQQTALTRSEINTLLNQINPHFLYNTLDTIYMQARINSDDLTMEMIQALSKYLRLSLSKGSDVVSVGDELENVRSYLKIMQIRNQDLFTYTIQCDVDQEKTATLKLILQPLVENCIKHGFSEIYEGGIITIHVSERNGRLIYTVTNNGLGILKEKAEFLNRASNASIQELPSLFPDKKHGYCFINLVTRLRLKYLDEASITYSTEGGTTVTVEIPATEVNT